MELPVSCFGRAFIRIRQTRQCVLSSSLFTQLNLSLAGASDWTAWGSGGTSVRDWRSVDLSVGESRNIWELSILKRSRSLATSSLLSILLIGSDIERDEKEEIRAEDTHASERSELLTSALAGVWHIREVGAGEVGVRGEVDEAEIDDELDDLEAGDPLLPPDADAARRLKVVPVHDDVDHQVEGDWNPGNRGEADELGVAEKSGGSVVVGVEESWAVC